MEEAIRLYLETIHEVAEQAGAAPLAAAIQLRERLAGRKVVLVLSGGNISFSDLRRILT
jgi:threonine dehydratase